MTAVNFNKTKVQVLRFWLDVAVNNNFLKKYAHNKAIAEAGAAIQHVSQSAIMTPLPYEKPFSTNLFASETTTTKARCVTRSS